MKGNYRVTTFNKLHWYKLLQNTICTEKIIRCHECQLKQGETDTMHLQLYVQRYSTDAAKSDSNAQYRQLCKELLVMSRSFKKSFFNRSPADEINMGESGYDLQLQFLDAVGHGSLFVFFLDIPRKWLWKHSSPPVSFHNFLRSSAAIRTPKGEFVFTYCWPDSAECGEAPAKSLLVFLSKSAAFWGRASSVSSFSAFCRFPFR